MNTDKKLAFKSNDFRDSESISSRHREKTENGIRKNRDKVTKRHRKPEKQIADGGVGEAIKQVFELPFMSNQQLYALSTLMTNARDLINPYFAPSSMYPEYANGPFLFNDNAIIAQLIQLFGKGNINAGHILINVSAADEPGVWINRLVLAGIVPILMQTINNPNAHIETRGSAFWIITNMCADNDNTRNAMISEPLLLTGMKMQTDPDVVREVYFAWKSFLAHIPLPMPNRIQMLWAHMPYTEDNNDLNHLRQGIMRVVRSGAPYQEWAYQSPDVMRLMQRVAAFYGCLVDHPVIREELLQKGILAMFGNFLMDYDVENRIWATLALTNLSKYAADQMVADRVLIERCISMIKNVDNNRLQYELYYFIVRLLNSSESARLLLLELDVVFIFVSLLASQVMRNHISLMEEALVTLYNLLEAYPAAAERFDELSGVEYVQFIFEDSENPSLKRKADEICTLLEAQLK
jgi:hypothetical protein